MVRESLAKKSVQPSLDEEKLHALVMELDEQKQESISGGIKSTFTKTKPHVNIGTIGSSGSSFVLGLVLLFPNPFS
jgi:hypothetical protein